ncbi:sugar ABC transporter ATP-binding protein [Pseudogracilibacillus sp. SO30301A]|uniref:sugar ABC transporter ATP-binding protein n=1 Tax=Pseudogracilibacillus sp. SO30301A TaxID=3098291 RepID=UPI00300E5134
MGQEYFVEMTGINKSFSGVHVLKDIHFNVAKGEVHALMGENGAGKSTLIKILSGVYTRDNGVVKVKGEQVSFTNPKEAEERGINIIHQELNIIPHLTVTQNMFLGKELTFGKLGFLNKKAMKDATLESLKELGVTNINPDELAGNLSVGQQQMIEIARALATKSELIIMDEPTAALTDREIEVLFEVVNSLRERGVSIIYVSHRMEEIFKICDRITVLRDGEYIGTENIKETSFDEVVRMMVGRELGERFPVRNAEIGDVVFEVKDLELESLFADVNLEVRAGEILGVAGLMGAGRTEVMETIFGYRKKSKGKIFLYGKELVINHPLDAIKAGLAFVTEDRKDKGLVINASIRENISLTNMNSFSSNGVVSKTKEVELVNKLMEKLHVRASGMSQEVKRLSGGNQQKVVIAKWIGISPKVLLLDEPTRGVDIGAKKEIYSIMNELSESGVAIIMVSSELPEVLGVSDRIMVLHEGKVTTVLNREEADQEKIMVAATGRVNDEG